MLKRQINIVALLFLSVFEIQYVPRSTVSVMMMRDRSTYQVDEGW